MVGWTSAYVVCGGMRDDVVCLIFILVDKYSIEGFLGFLVVGIMVVVVVEVIGVVVGFPEMGSSPLGVGVVVTGEILK